MPLALDDVLPRPVLLATLAVALLSLLIDLAPSQLEPEPVSTALSLRLREQQARFESQGAALWRSDVFQRHAEVLLEGEALAPEDLVQAADGAVFAGLSDGRVVRFSRSGDPRRPLEMRNFTRTGQELPACGTLEAEQACGRPLGLVFAPSKPFEAFIKRIPSPELFPANQVLLVADAAKGLLLVDAAGNKALLFNHVMDRATRERQRVNFMNGVAISRDGSTVFVTESSRKYARSQVVLEFLERHPSGRLLRFEPESGRVSVIAERLPFPNGLAMLEDAEGKESLLIALTTGNKLSKYSIEDSKLEDFAFLPSEPDNVGVEVINGKKVVIAGLATPSSGIIGYLKDRVKMRKVLGMLPPWVSVVLLKKTGSFVVLDAESGDVIRVIEDPTGAVAFFIAGATQVGEYLYLTSWLRQALVRIPVSALDL